MRQEIDIHPFTCLLGPAYSIAVTVTGTYARAKGKLSDHIATYQFKVEMDGYYHIWLDVLGTNSRDNGVFYIVNDSKQTKVNLIVKKGQPIWNRLDRQVENSFEIGL